MAGKSGGEKTEAPTPKRKKDARSKGQIPKSPDLVAWTGLLVASYLLKAVAAKGLETMHVVARQMETLIANPEPATALRLLGDATVRFGMIIVPLMLGLMAVGLVGNFAQVGFSPSTKPLKPKWERIDPFKGLKRLFSPQSAWEGTKSALKVAAIGLVVVGPLRATTEALVGADRAAVESVALIVGNGMISIMRNVALAGLVIAFVDYALVRRRMNKGMKMSKQEVKDEHKQSEGDPHVKGMIRERQMRMSRNRMMSDIATADAVIVNPTHIAIALRYDPASGAPRVVAKGAGAIAAKIREEAERHGVPLVKDVPLARTLYKVCEIGHEVPVELYEGVARLLAFVFALKARNLHRGMHELVSA